MIKDSLEQEVNIGDWIATIPRGARSVVIGKITSFGKTGNPKIKRNIKDVEEAVGVTVEYDYKLRKEYRKPHFVKIIPTELIDKSFEV